MFVPKPPKPGAKVALVAPSGPVSAEKLPLAVASVEKMGFQPVIFESCRAVHGYFAGNDRLRADDINRAFADPSIEGVLCIRGGYGAQRLMNLIDFGLIAANPKFFCGYSDITALHIIINQRCGFVTFHTPMASTEFYQEVDEFTANSYRNVLDGRFYGELKKPEGMPLKALIRGRARGILTGGNLSLVASSIGTPYEIDTKGKILFLEDVDEEPYRIDRMLTQLKNAGKFRDCAGVLLGYWTNCTAENPTRSLTLSQVFEELLVPEGKPILTNLACGHSLPSLSLPLGAEVEMDAFTEHITVFAGSSCCKYADTASCYSIKVP
ncbi:MAG: Muramoyltetrapeptide carboxypeptidase [Oscillospiraceae bacterium]|jgi:muramoyltetrapeptide carboxypeptidase